MDMKKKKNNLCRDQIILTSISDEENEKKKLSVDLMACIVPPFDRWIKTRESHFNAIIRFCYALKINFFFYLPFVQPNIQTVWNKSENERDRIR